MKKNWLALVVGVVLLLISCSLLFIGTSKYLVNKKVFYAIGTVVDFKGNILKEADEDRKLALDFNDPVYSNHRYKLGEDSYIEIEINGQTLNVLGPAEFTFNVIDAQSRIVFINFSEFTEVLPKDFESKSISLTYRGWMIQSFFDPVEDFENSEKRELEASGSINSEPTKEELSEPLPIPEDQKSSYLEEIISIKRPLLKKCYENYLLDNTMATGDLIVEFTLNTNGRVSSAKVKDSSFFRSEGFKLCIVNVFKQIRSRPFTGDHIQVTYPIEFM